MSRVKDQYEAFPYPARDPADEAKRLITGSPSLPVEMDHCLWGGQWDWSQVLRVLVAGGGTGDGLVQLAQLLHQAGKPYEITYLDLSTASRELAEARIKARNLPGVTFHTGSLLDAADYGAFDYIDCCGVLHHLPDPAAGLRALLQALAPGGGLGFMVYAPYGRAGVYPVQTAFNTLFAKLPPKRRLAQAKAVFAKLPPGHPLKRNPNIGDHGQSDAGFYDLLLHSQDQAFTVDAWLDVLADNGWRLTQFTRTGLYDLSAFADAPAGMNSKTQMATAEALRGTIKAHVGYARRASDPRPQVQPLKDRIPHLGGGSPTQLAAAVASGRLPGLRVGAEKVAIDIPSEAAGLIAEIDGRKTVADIWRGSDLTEAAAARHWRAFADALLPWGLLHYSGFHR